ncbi:hypothetical protein Tco_1540512, partial [Tanacetum coccineum]
VKDVMPLAEHRQRARHIYEGFMKQLSGVEFRGLLLAASKASCPQMFNKIMEKIKRANPRAHQYLLAKDPKTWSRAFFTKGRIVDVPAFVNNDIDEFEMGASNSKVAFNDGRVIQVGKINFNRNRMFGSSSTSHIKMRGGKTKAGRLIPAQRLRRMRAWLGMNAARSCIIEETKPLHASLPAINHVNTNGSNITGTQSKKSNNIC